MKEQINQIKEAIRAENEFFITSEFTTNQMLTHLTEEQTKAIQIYENVKPTCINNCYIFSTLSA